jgi:hypothetical protein
MGIPGLEEGVSVDMIGFSTEGFSLFCVKKCVFNNENESKPRASSTIEKINELLS